MEDIRFSQRIERFSVLDGETREIFYEGTTVGYKKIAGFSGRKTKELRIRIEESRGEPKLLFVGAYETWRP